ncbi:hypothetical protein L494_3246 [Bordetella bronchiseptica CA90 BB1334]|nr:hypothetical protein L576_3330 [Bordetella bronchiseptica OSU054]KDB71179.1 hypothetical protein L494_3246 [Bordetella bronchiseptica CA90 BB1334]KDD43645.1 hypothetical protein L532_3274 [Bordetella bronchiseptica OSU095]
MALRHAHSPAGGASDNRPGSPATHYQAHPARNADLATSHSNQRRPTPLDRMLAVCLTKRIQELRQMSKFCSIRPFTDIRQPGRATAVFRLMASAPASLLRPNA